MYSKKITITGYDVGPDETLRISSLMRYFQSLAIEDLNRQGMSYEFLREHNMVFVLTKYAIHISEKIRSDMTYDFITFPCLVNGPAFIRDFTVCDSDGNRIVEASSEWVLINFETRRLLRPSALPGTVKSDGKIHDFYPARTFVCEEEDFIYEFVVTHSLLDENRHMNNCNYLNVIYDGFYSHDRLISPVADLDINFAHEALLGDLLQIRYHFEDGSYHISCHNTTKDNVCFTAVLHEN